VFYRIAVVLAAAATAACTATPPASTPGGREPAPPGSEAPAVEAPVPLPAQALAARVTAVLDGDSLEVELGGTVQEVRIRGINAPERDECWGEEARAAATALLDDAEILLLADGRDQYGRLLADLWTGEGSVGLTLIRQGAALALTVDFDGAAPYRAAEDAAFAAGSGLWAEDACGPATDAMVAIARARFDAPGPDDENPNGEWVVVANAGPPVELTGWLLRDESSVHRFEFPEGFLLGEGAEVDVYSGCGTDRPEALFWCEGPVWSNSGDSALLLDPHGNVVDRFRS